MKTIPWEVYERRFSDAYVAGFFDGDGSLVATLEKQSPKYSRTYRPRIKINFTQHIRHREMMNDLQKYLGAGVVRVVTGHYQAEIVIVDRKDVDRILRRLLPHLVINKQQATLALEILSRMGENSRTNRISDPDYFKILEMIEEIRALNSNSGGKRKFLSYNPVTTSPQMKEGVSSSKGLANMLAPISY